MWHLDFERHAFFQTLAEQHNLCTRKQLPGSSYNWIDTTECEIKLFMGIHLAMGVHKLPSMEDYWSQHPLLGAPGICPHMPIWRFQTLHLSQHHNHQNWGNAVMETLSPRTHIEWNKGSVWASQKCMQWVPCCIICCIPFSTSAIAKRMMTIIGVLSYRPAIVATKMWSHIFWSMVRHCISLVVNMLC